MTINNTEVKMYIGFLATVFTVALGLDIAYTVLFLVDPADFTFGKFVIMAASYYVTVLFGKPLLETCWNFFSIDTDEEDYEYYYIEDEA